ncbi:hypothetical protein ACQPYA_16595 [Micromonospora sp. CA-263727]|uniref:hypothetical protein n=1 Tax=Micromonospora sp. CA-263727 TaxID=3239967 RepID=UPI003D913321
MTHPDDVTEALPTDRALPSPATGGHPDHTPPRPVPPEEPTVRLGGAAPTGQLTSGEPTEHLTGGTPTAPLTGGTPTVYLGGAAPTVDLGATSRVPTGDATVHLGPDQETVSLDQTVRQAVTEPAATGGDLTVSSGTSVTAGPAGARTAAEALAAPTAGPGGELRFGPGVPATPPPAPAWPAPAPPPRRRSAWRRLVSVLSTLLTLALLAAVGLWIWQRLSPLEIAELSVAVPRPAGEQCDVTVDVVATVQTNGRAGVIEYQWLRSGAAPGALLDERVGWGQRTVELTLRWSFSGVGSTTETATVNIVSPAPAQASTEVVYSCPG